MYACMYVCMYVSTHVCVHACMYVCTYACMYYVCVLFDLPFSCFAIVCFAFLLFCFCSKRAVTQLSFLVRLEMCLVFLKRSPAVF